MTVPPRWTAAQLIGFRFIFAYFALYDLPAVLGALPFVGRVAFIISQGTEALAIWTGARVLHLAHPIVIIPTGSGDAMGSPDLAPLAPADQSPVEGHRVRLVRRFSDS